MLNIQNQISGDREKKFGAFALKKVIVASFKIPLVCGYVNSGIFKSDYFRKFMVQKIKKKTKKNKKRENGITRLK